MMDSTAGSGLACQINQTNFFLVEILLARIVECTEDRESICEDDHIGLSLGSVACLRAPAYALKFVEHFHVAMVICASPSLHLTYTSPPPSWVGFAAEPSE